MIISSAHNHNLTGSILKYLPISLEQGCYLVINLWYNFFILKGQGLVTRNKAVESRTRLRLCTAYEQKLARDLVVQSRRVRIDYVSEGQRRPRMGGEDCERRELVRLRHAKWGS
jgi:hypothetical protein